MNRKFKLNPSSNRKDTHNFLPGKKLGMETLLINSKYIGVTVIDIDQLVTYPQKDSTVVIGLGKGKNIPKPQQYIAAGFNIVTNNSFDNTEDLLSNLNQQTHVSITSISRGKGTAGVMKRYGHKGGNRTHGNSLNHRTGGSYGQDAPRKMLKGTKMPGRHGNKKITIKNCKIIKIENNKLYLAASIAGNKKSFVLIGINKL